jgi:hypothetical protein
MTKRQLLTDAEWEALHQAFVVHPIDEVQSRFKQHSLRFKASYIYLHIYLVSYWLIHSNGLAQTLLPRSLPITDTMVQQVMSGRLLVGLMILCIMNVAFYLKIGFKTASLAMLMAYTYASLSMALVMAPLAFGADLGLTEFVWGAFESQLLSPYGNCIVLIRDFADIILANLVVNEHKDYRRSKSTQPTVLISDKSKPAMMFFICSCPYQSLPFVCCNCQQQLSRG